MNKSCKPSYPDMSNMEIRKRKKPNSTVGLAGNELSKKAVLRKCTCKKATIDTRNLDLNESPSTLQRRQTAFPPKDSAKTHPTSSGEIEKEMNQCLMQCSSGEKTNPVPFTDKSKSVSKSTSRINPKIVINSADGSNDSSACGECNDDTCNAIKDGSDALSGE